MLSTCAVYDVIPEYFNVLVPIWPSLLVKGAQNVEKLVDYDVGELKACRVEEREIDVQTQTYRKLTKQYPDSRFKTIVASGNRSARYAREA